MPANNNTTPLEGTTSLNMGVVGQRQFSDYNATEISGAISRENYKLQMKNSAKMKDFSEAVYKIVKGYSYEDKVNIITEYGDGSKLKPKMSEDDINKLCTECMIVHLDPATLKQLLSDLATKEATLRREVREKQKRTRTFTGFNTNTFNDVYKQIKDMKKNKFQNGIKSVDKSFHVPRYLTNQYPKLRKELYDVLQTCYNKIDIQRLAREMDINTPPGTTYKSLYKWITNKTILYVSLIIGRSKKADIGNAIVNPAPFEELLQYTSYSYVTGKPGMDHDAWAEKKEAARIAKKAIKEKMKLQKYKKNRFSKYTESNEFRNLTGGLNTKTVGGAAKVLKRVDNGILKNATITDLTQLAGKYGIDPTIKDIGKLKAEIYKSMAAESKYVFKLNKKKEKSILKGTINRDVSDRLAAHGIGNYNQLASPSTNNVLGAEGDSSTPTVRLFRNGKIRTKMILSAVPVYIVGQGLGGDRRTQEEIDAEKKRNSATNKLLNGKDGNGIKNSKIRGALKDRTNSDIIANIDPSITEDELGDNERKLLTYFKKLTFKGNKLLDGSDPLPGLKNLDNVRDILINYDYSKTLLDKIIKNAGVDEDGEYGKTYGPAQLLDLQLRYCWLYAKATGMNSLAAYLTKEYQIIYKTKTAGRKVKNFFIKASGIGAILKYSKKKKAKTSAAENIADMNDVKYSDSIGDITPTDPSATLAIPKILKASIKFDDIEEAITEVVPVYDIGTSKKLEAHSSGIEKILSLLTERIPGPVKMPDLVDSSDDSADSSGKKTIFGSAMEKALKLLNIKKPDEETTGSETNITAGIGKNHILTKNPKTNSVIFKTSIADALSKMKEAGYEENDRTSKVFLNHGDSTEITDKTYKLTTPDLEFIKGKELDLFKDLDLSSIIKAAPKKTRKVEPEPEIVDTEDDSTLSKEKIKIVKLDGIVGKIKSTFIKTSVAKDITDSIWRGPAIPVFEVNKDRTDNILSAINGVSTTIQSQFADLMLGLGAGFELAAPMGVGKGVMAGMLTQGIKNKILAVASDVTDVAATTAAEAFGAATGGIIRAPKAATGGKVSKAAINTQLKKYGVDPDTLSISDKSKEAPLNSVITGDAFGTNIFKGGARPELVQSTGDIKVTPLNKEGEEHRSKVTRMSSTERKQALATAVSSHIVKFSYKLSDGTTEISNDGEAIKVFPVKPGITDEILVGNVTTTMADMVMAIYNQLVSMGTISAANSQLLSSIASTSAASLKSTTSNNGNIFTDAGGFTSSLDSILGGD